MATTMNAAIQTFQLTKTYTPGNPPALTTLDLTVPRGEIFGYLGPNGAGKTTTIKVLLDLIRPTTGRAEVLGMDSRQNSVEIRKRIGFLPGELNLWAGLTAQQVIHYMGNLRGGVDWEYVKTLSDKLDFDLSKKVRSYSTGNKRKLGLILALMHKPELLILDEPTSGLDPLMQQIFITLMDEARSEGRTVFLSSHVLSEVQAICDRVAILREGKLEAVERVHDLMTVNFNWITVRTREPLVLETLAHVPGVAELTQDGTTVRFRHTGDFDPVYRALASAYIVELRSEEPNLEEVFLKFYGSQYAPMRNGKNGGSSYNHKEAVK